MILFELTIITQVGATITTLAYSSMDSCNKQIMDLEKGFGLTFLDCDYYGTHAVIDANEQYNYTIKTLIPNNVEIERYLPGEDYE